MELGGGGAGVVTCLSLSLSRALDRAFFFPPKEGFSSTGREEGSSSLSSSDFITPVCVFICFLAAITLNLLAFSTLNFSSSRLG